MSTSCNSYLGNSLGQLSCWPIWAQVCTHQLFIEIQLGCTTSTISWWLSMVLLVPKDKAKMCYSSQEGLLVITIMVRTSSNLCLKCRVRHWIHNQNTGLSSHWFTSGTNVCSNISLRLGTSVWLPRRRTNVSELLRRKRSRSVRRKLRIKTRSHPKKVTFRKKLSLKKMSPIKKVLPNKNRLKFKTNLTPSTLIALQKSTNKSRSRRLRLMLAAQNNPIKRLRSNDHPQMWRRIKPDHTRTISLSKMLSPSLAWHTTHSASPTLHQTEMTLRTDSTVYSVSCLRISLISTSWSLD